MLLLFIVSVQASYSRQILTTWPIDMLMLVLKSNHTVRYVYPLAAGKYRIVGNFRGSVGSENLVEKTLRNDKLGELGLSRYWQILNQFW